MKIEKRVLAVLERAYSIAAIPALSSEGVPALVAGSEGEGPLLLLHPPDFQKVQCVAEAPGGFVSLCSLQLEGRPCLLAVSDFKPGFQGEAARLLLFYLDETKPKPIEVACIPYAHRIAVMQRTDLQYLLVSTLCGGKAHKDDWSQPGAVYAARVPEKPADTWQFHSIADGLKKNHGFERGKIAGKDVFLISSMTGLWEMSLPNNLDKSRAELSLIDETEYSDAWSVDWNRENKHVVFSISPFHGNSVNLHSYTETGWEKQVIWDDLAFGHVLWADFLLDKPSLIAGSRRENMELRLYRQKELPHPGAEYEIIDEGVGAAQIILPVRTKHRALLTATAQAENAIVLYEFTV